MKRFDCLGAMIENEYGPYCYAAHADREIDKAREEGRTAYVSLLPADWFDDASLETWFPLTAQSMRELREAHGAAVIAQSEAVERMEIAEEQFRKAKDWNQLTELELNNLRSLKDDLEGHLSAVMEHIAPMLKLYEPNLPEHPVISAIQDYLDEP